MENNKEFTKPWDSQAGAQVHFSSEKEEKACFIDLRNSVLKLLYLIENEQRNPAEADAELFLFGLLTDISSANSMSNYKITKVLVKINALADNNFQYKTMTHAQIKRQIMESKGILDHLIGDKPKKNK